MNREKFDALLARARDIANRLADGYEVYWTEATLPMWHLVTLTFGLLFFGAGDTGSDAAFWTGVASIAASLGCAWIKGAPKP